MPNSEDSENAKDALFRNEQEKMRVAYQEQPGSSDGAGTWEPAEEWHTRMGITIC